MAQETLKGSCLCGQVSYELIGSSERFYHCHCQSCRKATGTGHASNIMIKIESFKWVTGEAALKRFNVPDAERFYNLFCSECGSPMPREVPKLGMTVVPAGTLDKEPEMNPHARIFWDSRTQWSCNGDEIVTYPEYAS